MPLLALIVCPDECDAGILQEVLRELNVETETCETVAKASGLLRMRPVDVVLLDSDIPEVAQLMDTIAQRGGGIRIIALLSPKADSEQAFQVGAHFVLYKPVSKDRALVSLEYAFKAAGKDRRQIDRQPIHLFTTLSSASMPAAPVMLLDLSPTGTALQTRDRLPPDSKLYFEFKVPGQTATIRMSGDLVWQDLQGRAGIRFANVPASSRKALDGWLQDNQSGQASLPVEEQLEVERFERQKPGAEAGSQSEQTVFRQELATMEHKERRKRSRYRYSAGVRVTEQRSQVPNWCNIADISEDGCYIEIALPFPKGTNLEMELRTHNTRVAVRGTVRTSHPGAGMGLQFTFQNEEQKKELQRAVKFLSAGTKLSKP